jgi:hypothetical protein
MDSSTTADIAQLSEIPKSMGFLFLLQIFKQKQTRPVRLYIVSIQPQHYVHNQRSGCLKSHFLTKLSCKATSIPRIIGAGLAYVGFVSFPWRPTCFGRSCVGLSKAAKYKIKKLKCQNKLHVFLWGWGILYWCCVWGWRGKVVRWGAKCM